MASDAIGMGLNLNIRRTIFHTTIKKGGEKKKTYWVSGALIYIEIRSNYLPNIVCLY